MEESRTQLEVERANREQDNAVKHLTDMSKAKNEKEIERLRVHLVQVIKVLFTAHFGIVPNTVIRSTWYIFVKLEDNYTREAIASEERETELRQRILELEQLQETTVNSSHNTTTSLKVVTATPKNWNFDLNFVLSMANVFAALLTKSYCIVVINKISVSEKKLEFSFWRLLDIYPLFFNHTFSCIVVFVQSISEYLSNQFCQCTAGRVGWRADPAGVNEAATGQRNAAVVCIWIREGPAGTGPQQPAGCAGEYAVWEQHTARWHHIQTYKHYATSQPNRTGTCFYKSIWKFEWLLYESVTSQTFSLQKLNTC